MKHIIFLVLLVLATMTSCNSTKDIVDNSQPKIQWERGEFSTLLLEEKQLGEERLPNSKASINSPISLREPDEYLQIEGKHHFEIRQIIIPTDYVGVLSIVEKDPLNNLAPRVLRENFTTEFKTKTEAGNDTLVKREVKLDFYLVYEQHTTFLRQQDVNYATLSSLKASGGYIDDMKYLRSNNGNYMYRNSDTQKIALATGLPKEPRGYYWLKPLPFSELSQADSKKYQEGTAGLARTTDGKYVVRNYQTNDLHDMTKDQMEVKLKVLAYRVRKLGLIFDKNTNGF
ncbi:MAG: hypothetical protein ACJA2Z_000324 [Candidatus Paceibacteria bacterium]|jgi:hypothetical protein